MALPASRSPFVLGLQAEALKYSLPIQVGIHEPSDDHHRVKNSLIWIDSQGQIAHRYQKLHLFDVDIRDGPLLKESNSVEPGTAISKPYTTSIGKIGAMICFDLRFPALSSRLRDLGSEVLTYPSAFTVPTGEAGHWETLLRARAIENQCYVIAAAQVGRHGDKRASYGHSMIIDPWGKILARAGGIQDWEARSEKPEIISAKVDQEALTSVRREMPLLPRRDLVDVRARTD